MKLHAVSIVSPGISGHGTRLWLDQREVVGVRDIKLHIGLDEPTVLVIEMLVEGVDVDADASSDEVGPVQLDELLT